MACQFLPDESLKKEVSPKKFMCCSDLNIQFNTISIKKVQND